MGLDMYAYTTQHGISEVDFADPGDAAELFYWRKHPNLHGWMEKLYRRKGGRKKEFNVVAVRLDEADLDELEKVVLADKLPFTSGFFFGESGPDDKKDDLEFIGLARKAIEDGKHVVYTSWW